MKKMFNCGTLSPVRRSNRAPSIQKVMGALGLSLAISVSSAFAADFQVQPTSLILSSDAKSGAFTVLNDGNDSIDFQVDVKEWSQDAAGKDVYSEARDVVFFPKIMTVAAHEQRAIRIGIKSPPSQREKTYRVFVEEIPTPKKETEVAKTGNIRAGLTIAFRFATPIFVMPVKPQRSAEVARMEMAGGAVKALIRNTGNVHIKLLNLKFRGLAADGKELFSKEIAGWYILNGMAVPYEAAVPKEQCRALSSIEVKAQAADPDLNIAGSMPVDKSMCAP